MGEITTMNELIDRVKQLDSFSLYKQAVRDESKNSLTILKAITKIGTAGEVEKIEKAINKLSRNVLFTVMEQILKEEIKKEYIQREGSEGERR